MLERTGTFSKARLLSTSNIENETFGKSIVQDNNPKKAPPPKKKGFNISRQGTRLLSKHFNPQPYVPKDSVS